MTLTTDALGVGDGGAPRVQEPAAEPVEASDHIRVGRDRGGVGHRIRDLASQ